MEINVLEGHTDYRGIYDITDFEFTALCLLEVVNPCFQGSELNIYSATDFKKKMDEMMAELREFYGLNNASTEVNGIQTNESLTEGGEKALDNEIEMNAVTIEDDTEDELAKFSEPETEAISATETENESDETTEKEVSEFALTQNILDELMRQLGCIETVETPWGIEPRYWYRDCDFDAQEVYCIDGKDWLLYGFKYVMDGDAISIDVASKKRMKYVITEFDGGNDQPSIMADVFAKIEAKLGEMSDMELKYNEASARISEMESELNGLREYKNASEAAIAESKRAGILDRFSDLSGIPEFDALCESSTDYDADALEEKCYAIRGKNITTVKFSSEHSAPKFILDKSLSNFETDPYGGIVAKFASQNN
jgi:hypothetical protein